MKRTVYKPLGFVFLALAVAGILLPILPTTPFLLASAWFFARSSEKWHRRLLESELFGPLISNWENKRCISCRTKVVAIVSMVCAGGVSVFYAVESTNLKIMGLVLMSIGATVVLRIATCPADDIRDA